MRDLIKKISAGEFLSKSEAGEILRVIAEGKASEAEIAEFLIGFRNRLPNAEEFSGFRNAMLSAAVPLPVDRELFDLCGTGGDGKNTFNISTATAFVLASCGVTVAKHGNNGSSSSCGSSNALQALGIPFPKNQSEVLRQLDAANLTFLHAPLWHPAMSAVAAVRKRLGFKTVFCNLLGPVVNPAGPRYQLLGVHSPALQNLYSETLAMENCEFAVVHAADGYDEISLTSSALIRYSDKTATVVAGDFGAEAVFPDELAGRNSIEENAALLERILKGMGTPAQSSVVAANAAIALTLKRKSEDLKSLFTEALEVIRAGRAFDRLQILRSEALP